MNTKVESKHKQEYNLTWQKSLKLIHVKPQEYMESRTYFKASVENTNYLLTLNIGNITYSIPILFLP